MTLELYNTYSRKKEIFKPLEDNIVKIYSCGPTVYSKQHIGNLRAAIFSDVLKRSLRFFGYIVDDVVNITDVGHLTSDSDEGEDKMLKAMKKENKDPFAIARAYEDIYIEDLKKLNIVLPKHLPRATEHIDEQITIIKKLEEKGYTYVTLDGVYFDVSKFKDYGKLSKQSLDEKKAGASGRLGTQTTGKRSPSDFALWKFTTGENKNHIMKWESPWGVGFPGWHLECSAMSSKYLGEKFDIHTGGIDHIPIHHENEIAQNTCSGCVKKVNFWMHNDFMKVDGEKMSKSLGNVYVLDDIITKGFSPLAFREVCLRAHYRKQINFTFESLEAGQINVERYNNFYSRIQSLTVKDTDDESNTTIKNIYLKYLNEFTKALADDINTSEALAALHEFMNEINAQEITTSSQKNTVIEFIKKIDSVLGLLETQDEVPKEIEDLAQLRKRARDNKDFSTADSLRDELAQKGWEVKDAKDVVKGYLLSRKK